jgi:hypothetical protein
LYIMEKELTLYFFVDIFYTIITVIL